MAALPISIVTQSACICVMDVSGVLKNRIKNWIKNTADTAGLIICSQDADHWTSGTETKGLMIYIMQMDDIGNFDSKVRIMQFAESFRLEFGLMELHVVIFGNHKSIVVS